MKTCLLIMPMEFHGFLERISNALSAQGYLVTPAHHEFPAGLPGKVLARAAGFFSRALTSAYLRNRFLRTVRYDLVLIIKGRGVESKIVDEMRTMGSTVIGYTWDSTEFCDAPLRWYQSVSRFCTFDYRDAQRLSREVVELFAANEVPADRSSRRYRIAAVMKNYDRRLRYTHQVLKALEERDVFIYIYEDSIFSLLWNLLRSPRLHWTYRRSIHLRPMQPDHYAAILAASEWTIDYVRDDQSGITMRCFEAAAASTRIITNNTFIRESTSFDESAYLVYQLDEAPDAIAAAYVRMCGEAPRPSVRTISQFVTDLVGA